jgi:hypothetical protein
MRSLTLVVVLTLSSLGCSGVGRPIWHDQQLPSGRMVKVTSFNLVWGVEHDERDTNQDSFALEFATTTPTDDPAAQQQEALEVFELIRQASELWGFKTADVSRFPTVERKGRYDIFRFTRGRDGRWTVARQSAKVFANDI